MVVTELDIPRSTPEGWACLSRPTVTEGVTLAWRPLDWETADRNYSIAVSRKGILIGDVYLNEIPQAILDAAYATFHALQRGDEAIMAQVTHIKERRGRGWALVPVQREALDV